MTGDTFETLLAPSLPSVRRFVQTRLRASDHADDIIQETLLHAFAHRDQLRASSKFKSWLCSIAMNEVRMFFRTDRPTLSLDEFPHIDSRDSEPSPLAKVEQKERLEWLQAGMEKLSDRDRAAIRLRDFEGLSLTETAEAFDSSEAAAKSSHFRARKRLASAVRSACGTSGIERGRLPGPSESASDGERRPRPSPRLSGTARRKSPGCLFGGTAGTGGLGLVPPFAPVGARRQPELPHRPASDGSISRVVIADVSGQA
jgi:RNA polymerase sigma-70 factor, ECF subfamily